jgi:chromosome segregation ATPase
MSGMPDVIIRVMRDLHEKSQYTSNQNPSVYGDAADLIETLRARAAELERANWLSEQRIESLRGDIAERDALLSERAARIAELEETELHYQDALTAERRIQEQLDTSRDTVESLEAQLAAMREYVSANVVLTTDFEIMERRKWQAELLGKGE